MKKLLTLILCWLLAFSAMAETTFKAKTALSAAGGYVTSQNKVDGSFEDGTAGWSASVGTIVKTASTELQGNNVGTWSGTGAGTLDLQWTATASNTYEASAQVNVSGEDDVYVCAYVGTTETGCKLIPALNKIQKVSVVADSVMSSAFNLRLKHTGSDAFSIDVDDGKIEPWTPQAVNLVEQESVTYTGYSTGTNPVVFLTKDTTRSNEKNLIEVSTVGSAGTASKYKILKVSNFTVSATVYYVNSGGFYTVITHYDSSNNIKKRSILNPPAGAASGVAVISGRAEIGDYFTVATNSTVSNVTDTFFSITATAISNNVVQSWQPSGSLGELKFLPQNIAPQGFIPAMGSSIGKTAGTYQGDAYYDLYKVLWTQSSVTAGEPYVISSAKGTDAATDWAANKTITIDVSGLVVRAFKSGTTGAVGAKQLDAFQGHGHNLTIYNGSGDTNAASLNSLANSNGTASSYKNAAQTGILRSNSVATPTDDGTNGTPRTATETRMTNIAQYAFIRYGNDAPTLLALPVSKENRFEITVNADGTIAKKNSSLITSVKTGTGLYTIDYSALGLTAAPILKMEEQRGINTQASAAIRVRDFVTVTATQATVRTGYNNAGNGVLEDNSFAFTLVKQSPDYTAPGVFVGNVAKNQVATIKGTSYGSFSAGSWINILLEPDNGSIDGMSFSGGAIVLQPGTYSLNGQTMFYRTEGVQTRLYNATDSVDMNLYGLPGYARNIDTNAAYAQLTATFTIYKPTTIFLQGRPEINGTLGISDVFLNTTLGKYKSSQYQIVKLNGQ